MTTSAESFPDLAGRVSNWGRWGEDDQLGTLNLITDAKVRESAALVRRGAIFALGVNFDDNLPWGGSGFRQNPMHLMRVDGGDGRLDIHLRDWGTATEAGIAAMWANPVHVNDDLIILPLQCGTQWDALAHVHVDGQMYNGHPAAAVTSFGATRNSIDQVDQRGVVSRGVLLDVARHRGVEHLGPGDAVGPDELDEICERQSLQVTPGDIVLVRLGWWPQLERLGGAAWMADAPGVHWRAADWLHRNDVAAVACDNVRVELPNWRVKDAPPLPLHWLCLREMGMLLGEIWNLEELAEDCARDGIYEFQLVAPPLRITGAVGSPLNPLALK